MPWQQYVADVALEIDPLTGQLAYQEFGLTVPRQSGKSTLLLAKALHRGSATKFFGPRQRVVYTAQTRKDARKKFEEDYAGVLEGSREFRNKADCRWGNGNEHIRLPNGSRFTIEANTEKSGHGPTIDEAYIDEAFAQIDNRMEQAFRPAMITRRNKQLAWVSTAGWRDGSPYLQAKVRRGRTQAEMGIREGLAYFEWSAPEDADPEDRSVWRECMPALGQGLITEQAIAGELAGMDPNDFRRAYLNQWVPKTSGGASVLKPETWAALDDPDSKVLDPVALAIAVSKDRSWSAIAKAGRRVDGFRHVEVIEYRPGTEWVVDRLGGLVDELRPCAVLINPAGPEGSLIKAIEEKDIRVRCHCHDEQGVQFVTVREVAQACGEFYDACVNDDLRHLDQKHLNVSVSGVRTRITAEGSWLWSRMDSEVEISPLYAATLANFGYSEHGHHVEESLLNNIW